MLDKCIVWRRKCRKHLNVGEWYRYEYAAKVLGNEKLDYNQTVGFFSLFADFETKKEQIAILHFKEYEKPLSLSQEQASENRKAYADWLAAFTERGNNNSNKRRRKKKVV